MRTVATDRGEARGGFQIPEIPGSEECFLRMGNSNCGGCGMSIGLNLLGGALA